MQWKARGSVRSGRGQRRRNESAEELRGKSTRLWGLSTDFLSSRQGRHVILSDALPSISGSQNREISNDRKGISSVRPAEFEKSVRR